MDSKKFIVILSCLTAVVCLITVIYNFASMPPYGASSASAVPLFVSQVQPLSYSQSSVSSKADTSSVDKTSSAVSASSDSSSGGDGKVTTSSVSSHPKTSGSSKTSQSSSPSKATTQNPVNINTAALTQLETIPYIGQVKAQAIFDYRAAHGNFKSINDLDNIKGIGAKTIAKIAAYITVG
jgi:competence protein ComEA